MELDGAVPELPGRVGHGDAHGLAEVGMVCGHDLGGGDGLSIEAAWPEVACLVERVGGEKRGAAGGEFGGEEAGAGDGKRSDEDQRFGANCRHEHE